MKGRKRSEMKVGALDNITQACPQKRHRFAPWAAEEVGLWLLMHVMQHDRVMEKCEQAAKDKAGRGLKEQAAYHNLAIGVIQNLIVSLRDTWDSVDWWAAVELMEDTRRKDAAELPADTRPNPFE